MSPASRSPAASSGWAPAGSPSPSNGSRSSRRRSAQERLDYERDVAEDRARATDAGEEPPEVRPWSGERYGWTWLERWLSPALGAIGFGAFAAHEAFGTGLLIHLLWISIFVQIVNFDLKHRLILNVITYPSILVAVVLSDWSPGLTLTSSLIGAIGVALFFLIQNLVSRGSIGLGDAKLGALVGAVTGAGPTGAHLGAVYAVIAGVFIGGAAALALLVNSRPQAQRPDTLWSVPVCGCSPHPVCRPVTRTRPWVCRGKRCPLR